MNEEQHFVDMLRNHNIKYDRRASDPDDVLNGTTIEIASGRHSIVNSFAHCFCEFTFDRDGTLANIKFGY